MTTLEATTEIVKAAIANSSSSNYQLIQNGVNRKAFLTGIEELYNKLKELESENRNTNN